MTFYFSHGNIKNKKRRTCFPSGTRFNIGHVCLFSQFLSTSPSEMELSGYTENRLQWTLLLHQGNIGASTFMKDCREGSLQYNTGALSPAILIIYYSRKQYKTRIKKLGEFQGGQTPQNGTLRDTRALVRRKGTAKAATEVSDRGCFSQSLCPNSLLPTSWKGRVARCQHLLSNIG